MAFAACSRAADKKNQEGRAAYEEGDYQKAAQLFQEAITEDNTNAEYYVNLGMVHLELEAYDAAMTQFDNAL